MSETLYVKYNRLRNPRFQTCTRIVRNAGGMKVIKSPLNEESLPHVNRMISGRERLVKCYPSLDFVEVETKDGVAVFDYLRGDNLGENIAKSCAGKSKDEIVEIVLNAVNRLFDAKTKPFETTDDFAQIFGEVILPEGQVSFEISNIDCNFDNVILVDDRWVCIDYEWSFEIPIPVKFLQYRSVFYFAQRFDAAFKGIVDFDDFMKAFDISDAEMDAFARMEESFQQYVFGKDRCYRYTERYAHRNIPWNEVENFNDRRSYFEKMEKDFEKMEKDFEKMEKDFEKSKMVISSMERESFELRSSIRDKDRHINNIEADRANVRAKAEGLQLRLDAEHAALEKYRRFLPIRILRICKRFITTGHLRASAVIEEADKVSKLQQYEKFSVPQFDKPAVSIVIPAYNQFDYNYNCIKSIVENSVDASYEIILADDVSIDETAHIEDIISGLVISRNSENLRFLRNCNKAAQLAKGDYILFLNNDTRVHENWLQPLINLIESSDDIGMVGSKLVYPDGVLQEAGGIVWNDGSAWNYGRYQDADMPEYNYVREVDYISGAAIMIRRTLWEDIGGFDELFAPAYCEDSDLAFQVRERGYKVMYQPLSVVTHFEGVSNGTDTSEGLKKYQIENTEKLQKKWAERIKEQYPNGKNVLRAMERNHNRPVILIIDHYVPTFDKDAGSRTIFQYIKMFLNKGYCVKFLGDNFAHEEPYTSTLEQMGIEVLYGEWYQTNFFDWAIENKELFDIVFMNRPHISVKYIDFFKKNTNAKIIYYGMDLHFLRVNREAELTSDYELNEEAALWQFKEMNIIKKADMSYFLSTVEEQIIHELEPSANVKVMSVYAYDVFLDDFKYISEDRHDIAFVGGFSHTPNIDAVLWFANEIFPLIREKSDIKFHIIGSNAPDEVKALGDMDGIVFEGFVSDERLSELYSECRMIVVPLRYGAGVKGKVIEALYNGLPIVTTSIGAEGIEGIENVTVIKDEPEDFAQAVLELYNDSDRLTDMANRTQSFIKANFSIDAAWDKIKDDFTIPG